jgi:hypothetical protein
MFQLVIDFIMTKNLLIILTLVCLFYISQVQTEETESSTISNKSDSQSVKITDDSPLLMMYPNFKISSDKYKFSKSDWSLEYTEEKDEEHLDKMYCNLTLKLNPSKQASLAFKNNGSSDEIKFQDHVLHFFPSSPIQKKLFKKTLFPISICKKFKALERKDLDNILKIGIAKSKDKRIVKHFESNIFSEFKIPSLVYPYKQINLEKLNSLFVQGDSRIKYLMSEFILDLKKKVFHQKLLENNNKEFEDQLTTLINSTITTIDQFCIDYPVPEGRSS